MSGIRITQLPEKLTAPEQGDFFVIDDGTTAQKVDFDTLAASVLEAYDGSTLGGSAQSVQDAIDGREAVDTNATYTTSSNINYIKKHGYVNVWAFATGQTLSANTWVTLTTLPADYRPSVMVYGCATIGNSAQYPGLIRVGTDGKVEAYTHTAVTNNLVVFNITYAVE